MNKLTVIIPLIMVSTFCHTVYSQETPRRLEPRTSPPQQPRSTVDVTVQLQNIIAQQNLQAIDIQTLNLPNINSEKAQLGKQLFFTKNLGGTQSVACVSCHHPSLGGSDALSLPVGVLAVDANNISAHALLGLGRFNGNSINNLPNIPRNTPTVFNIGLNEQRLFWDSRVERNRNGDIITPDSAIDNNGRRRPDSSIPSLTSLAAAQARFPVTSHEEMRDNFLATDDNQTVRENLAMRFDNSLAEFQSTWHQAFNQVYNDNSVTFERISDAIAEYERSMVFINNPWQRYLSGDNNALTTEQKAGAVLFFTPSQRGGAGCVNCHNGPTFSNNQHHLVAFPQIGVGTNGGENPSPEDFGRENVTNNIEDRLHFKTPSLLNVATTAPYGHSGAYQSLTEVVLHYTDPSAAIERLFGANAGIPFTNGVAPYCVLPQIKSLIDKNNLACEDIFNSAYSTSKAANQYLEQAILGEVSARAPLRARPTLSDEQVSAIVAFLHALTDPCTTNRACLSPWIIDQQQQAQFPDDQLLLGHNKDGDLL